MYYLLSTYYIISYLYAFVKLNLKILKIIQTTKKQRANRCFFTLNLFIKLKNDKLFSFKIKIALSMIIFFHNLAFSALQF